MASAQLSTCMLLFGPGVIADRLQTVLMDASVVRGVLRTMLALFTESCRVNAMSFGGNRITATETPWR